ncbi:hypothetical protein LTR56_005456 [Elasticomyces elasticus]|nr:hypothetical protein LTR56_005456 [Elasticomyces elasticus]KAK3665420.1 hypothetical protein LTR22_003650 [Elasticomyces elasticus]KAK4929936.1 hypothetical protein LTR49_003563 [Elasticomyces elasticus]KAK5769254.1 hypothetical protein LTS12_000605 [Elasticomyces elasticus]
MPLIATGYTEVSSLNYFTTPPAAGPISYYNNNPNYTIGQQLSLQWQTNITGGVSLWLYQVASTWEYAPVFTGQYPVPTEYAWNVSNLDFDLTNGTVFYFHLTNSTDTRDGDPIPGCFSHFFNILEAESSSALGESSSASASPPTTTSSTGLSSQTAATLTNTSPPATATPLQSASTIQPSSISSGAKTGIGVGVGLGAAALVLGFLIWWCLRRKRSASWPGHSRSIPTQQQENRHCNDRAASVNGGFAQYEKQRQPLLKDDVKKATPHEMPVNEQRHELEGGENVHELAGR